MNLSKIQLGKAIKIDQEQTNAMLSKYKQVKLQKKERDSVEKQCNKYLIKKNSHA